MLRLSSGILPFLLAATLTACGSDAPTDPPETRLTWTSASAGKRHTCAIRSDGAAYCWGANQAGQLGSPGTWAAPAAVGGGLGWKAIAAGEGFTCGIAKDGKTYCWGDVEAGMYRRPDPKPVGNDPGFRVLSAGSNHVCGISATGESYCWGSNFRGQLGVGPIGNTLLGNSQDPVRVAGSEQFGTIAAGEEHTCALSTAGDAYCWGSRGSNEREDVPRKAAQAVSVQSLVVGGTATRSHACGAVGADVFCWGFNRSGQLGAGFVSDNSAVGYTSAAVRVQRPAGIVLSGLTAGGGPWYDGLTGHTCGVSAEGTGYCWGDNRFGQLGDGSTTSRAVPTPVPGGLRFASLQAGGNHTCGITRDGDLYCWGANFVGQLGNGTSGQWAFSASPIRVAIPS